MVSWISAGFEHIMSRLGFCLTWRIDVFRDKNTTVSYTSARLRQQVQFFQYWVCKMYIIFWEGKLPKHDDQATSRSSRQKSLRWFSRWKLQVQSGGGRLFGRLKRGRSGHWVKTPISPWRLRIQQFIPCWSTIYGAFVVCISQVFVEAVNWFNEADLWFIGISLDWRQDQALTSF